MMKQWLSERMELEMNNDTQMKTQNRNRQAGGFTLIEMLVVIAIIGILAGLLTVGATAAVKKNKLTRVSVQMKSIETAIEGYKAKFGFYPPDNADTTQLGWSQTNTLFYELSGTTFDPSANPKKYTTLDGNDSILADASFKTLLHVDNIHNAGAAGGGKADDATTAQNFLKIKSTETELVTTPSGVTLKLLDVPVEGVNKSDINPWHYNSHNPTNNADGYDLWAEFLIGKQTYIIGNWNHNPIAK
jgi:prepilin-type N-terminal cleavage/methylation domain-containing protein